MRVDRRAVVRAITNLIDNAVRYSDQDQQVTVGVEVFGETAAISVKDDGVGLRAELERVFERLISGPGSRRPEARPRPGHCPSCGREPRRRVLVE